MADSYKEYVRKQILEERQKERLYEIKELGIKLGTLYEELFRLKVTISAFEKKREALKEEYKKNHPQLYKGWDVT